MGRNDFDDARFSHIKHDPRYTKMARSEQKTKIDKRFHGMFKDDQFKLKYTMDKRGRPLNKTTTEELKRFYDISDSDESSEEEDEEDDKKEDSSDESEESDEIVRLGEGPDYARGAGNTMSDSDTSDDSDSDDDEVQDEVDHKWGEQDAVATTEVTNRLAVCNMDWDRIKAADLFFLFESFKPPSGIVFSVKIYPSEYGAARMTEEERIGPVELSKENDEDKTDENVDELKERERLRAYQMKRLKYYYAVVEFDSPETANTIYTECDGLEFEASCAIVDLRFIPDDVTFDTTPTSVCTETPNRDTYIHNNCINSALGQSQVTLTWDETNPDRKKYFGTKFTKEQIENEDFNAYLASESEEEVEGDEEGVDDKIDDKIEGVEDKNKTDSTKDVDKDKKSEKPKTKKRPSDKEPSEPQIEVAIGSEEDESDSEGPQTEEARVKKYRQLLSAINEDERKKSEGKVSMEVTWEPGVLNTGIEVKKPTKDHETTWDKYLQKRKDIRSDKKKSRKLAKQVDPSDEFGPTFNGDHDSDEGGDAAFSDDEIPDSYTKETKENITKSNKKSRKKIKGKQLTKKEQQRIQKERDELSLLMDEDDDDRRHFNLPALVKAAEGKKTKKRKHGSDDEEEQPLDDDFEVDVGDQRFSAIYSSRLFSIDPSAPQYKKTKGMEDFISEKTNRRLKKGVKNTETITEKTPQTVDVGDVESYNVKSLVKRVKSKTISFNKQKANKKMKS